MYKYVLAVLTGTLRNYFPCMLNVTVGYLDVIKNKKHVSIQYEDTGVDNYINHGSDPHRSQAAVQRHRYGIKPSLVLLVTPGKRTNVAEM